MEAVEHRGTEAGKEGGSLGGPAGQAGSFFAAGTSVDCPGAWLLLERGSLFQGTQASLCLLCCLIKAHV